MRLRLLFHIILYIISQKIFGQTYIRSSLQVLNGKPLHVFGFYNHPSGLKWLCTSNGLKRYDAYEVKSYNQSPNGLNAIADDIVFKCVSGKDGTLYIGTKNGLSILDVAQDRFDNVLVKKNTVDEVDNTVTNIYLDKEGRLWLSCVRGLYYFDTARRKVIDVISDKINKAYFLYPFTSIVQDLNGKIWVGNSGNGLFQIDNKSLAIKQFSIKNNNAPFLNHDHITHLTIDGVNLWISSYKGVSCYNISKGTYSKYLHDSKDPSSLIFDSTTCILVDAHTKDQVWIGTMGRGIELLNLKTGKFKHFTKNNQHNSSDFIISAMQLDNGTIWIGTDKGLEQIHAPGQQFYSNPKPFITEDIASTTLDNKGIWISSAASYTLKFIEKTKATLLHNATVPNGGGKRMIVDSLGNLWIAKDSLVVKYNPKTGTEKLFFELDPEAPNYLKYKPIWTLRFGQEGKLWIGTGGGGAKCLDTESGKFVYFHKKSPTHPLSGDFVGPILENKDAVWIGTHGKGLCRLDKSTNKVSLIKEVDSKLQDNLKTISSLFEDRKGRLWMGSPNGLMRYDQKERKLLHYRTTLPVDGREVLNIGEAKNGNLWYCTKENIVQQNPNNGQYTVFDENDGIDIDFDWAHFGYANGQLLFGGDNGYIIFQPDSIHINMAPPKIAITKLIVLNKNGLQNENVKALHNDTIELDHSVSGFTLQFSALNFVNSSKNQYAYKLIGEDESYIYSGNKRSATYKDLRPGTYTFHIKASNNDNVWNSEGKKITIIVHAAFWQTWWFKLTVILSLIALAIYLKKRFTPKPKTAAAKATTPTVTEDVASLHLRELQQLMQDKKLYLDPELTQQAIAKELNIPVYLFSKILNEHLKLTFTNYINQLRIEEAKRILLQKSKNDFTNFGIAQDCGYKNETVFYRNFKKITGLTPTEYRKKNLPSQVDKDISE